MVLVLAVSDEMDDALCADVKAVREARLIVACGDLPFDYLGYLMNALDVPLVFVPGNRVHQGFEALHWLTGRLQPPLLLHGHIHPDETRARVYRLGRTVVRNVVGHHLLDIEPGADGRRSLVDPQYAC